MEQELQKEQKCSFYALEQLRQTAEAILRGSQCLLKCRAGVEKYRTAHPESPGFSAEPGLSNALHRTDLQYRTLSAGLVPTISPESAGRDRKSVV